MKSMLCLILTTLVVASHAQTDNEKIAPLVVVKFNCGTHREPNNVVRSVQDPDPPLDPITTSQPPPRNERQDMRDRREMNARVGDLRGAEIVAARSADKGVKMYFYHLEVKNIGSRKIKTFAWEYQSTGVADISDRQFLCAVNANPNDKKVFDLLSPLSPSRVVDARTASEKADKNPKGVVVINQVEYTDGSKWTRPGWNTATFSADASHKVKAGTCLGL